MTTEERKGERGPESARKKQLLEWLLENGGGAEATLDDLSKWTGMPRRSVQWAMSELKKGKAITVSRTHETVFHVEVSK